MLYLLTTLLAYCGLESDELEGVELPAYMFAELEEAGKLSADEALIWEYSISTECWEADGDESLRKPIMIFLETGSYKDSCLLIAAQRYDEADALKFQTDLDVRTVVTRQNGVIVQRTHWRERAALMLVPFSQVDPTCLEIKQGRR